MKYIISSIIFLLLISSGILGYGYYRQYLQLESKNIQISNLEIEIRELNGNIQELEQKNKSLQQGNKQLADTVAVQKKRIDQLEKFITEKNLNVPQQTSAENSNSKDTPVKTEPDVTEGSVKPANDPASVSSSLWCWILVVLLAMTTITIVICKMRKKTTSNERKNKKFICPSCGWEYRTTVTECENCKTKF